MMELNLLESFPKAKRRIEKNWRTEENKVIARRFDKDFFDGDRINGYGGYYYDGRWKGVVKKLEEVYGINERSSVLDIGCAKGFLLHDLQEMIPGIKVAGIDVSEYAVNHTMDGYASYLIKNGQAGIAEDYSDAMGLEEKARNDLLPKMIIGSAERLPWVDNSFDVVLSINTSHNLPEKEMRTAIQEMRRVCKPAGHQFIQLDAWRNDQEKEDMLNWSITARTMKSDKEWLGFLKDCDYDGNYFWTIA